LVSSLLARQAQLTALRADLHQLNGRFARFGGPLRASAGAVDQVLYDQLSIVELTEYQDRAVARLQTIANFVAPSRGLVTGVQLFGPITSRALQSFLSDYPLVQILGGLERRARDVEALVQFTICLAWYEGFYVRVRGQQIAGGASTYAVMIEFW